MILQWTVCHFDQTAFHHFYSFFIKNCQSLANLTFCQWLSNHVCASTRNDHQLSSNLLDCHQKSLRSVVTANALIFFHVREQWEALPSFLPPFGRGRFERSFRSRTDQSTSFERLQDSGSRAADPSRCVLESKRNPVLPPPTTFINCGCCCWLTVSTRPSKVCVENYLVFCFGSEFALHFVLLFFILPQ